MIEIKDDTKEKCQDCPMFSPETTCNKFYGDNKVVKTVDRLESDFALWLFWIVWIILIGVCVYGFYYLDNEWLE